MYRRCFKTFLSCLNVNKAPGIEQIPAKFLKKTANVLAYPLSKIINSSVKLTVFLEKWKIDKLKPLLKKSSEINPKNSIPYQLHDCLNPLYKDQLGFRANFSNDSCLAQLTDFALTIMVQGIRGCILTWFW